MDLEYYNDMDHTFKLTAMSLLKDRGILNPECIMYQLNYKEGAWIEWVEYDGDGGSSSFQILITYPEFTEKAQSLWDQKEEDVIDIDKLNAEVYEKWKSFLKSIEHLPYEEKRKIANEIAGGEEFPPGAPISIDFDLTKWRPSDTK
jgi:hypothetical protein